MKSNKGGIVRQFLLIILLFASVNAYAGDTHQDGQGHKVTYTVVDTSGNPVSGQTVSVALNRESDNKFLDWSDNTFKASGWTTRLKTMTYNSVGEFYESFVTIDSAVLASDDYVITVSNDDATYGDFQAETISWNATENLIKIHR